MDSEPRHDQAVDAAIEVIELEAAEWLVRRDHGLSAADRRELERWLAADPRHGKAWARLGETWRLLDAVPAERVALPSRRGRRAWWAAVPLAAAAALAVVFLPMKNGERAQPESRRAATAVGEWEVLTLADGSRVRLNTASEVTVDFSAAERRVTLLRGEASFEVTRDAARPFVVRAGEVDVRVVGTVFNVRQDARAVEVLVVEGRVEVDNAGATALAREERARAEPRVLTAGQRATIARGAGEGARAASVAEVAPAESARALAWHHRQLEFSEEPLAKIAAEFNRYNTHRLVVADAELGEQRFGGKFPANDFAGLVRLLELNFGVVAERREHETVLRRARAGR